MITIILDDGGRITTDEDINPLDMESHIKYGNYFMTLKNLDDGTTVDFPASKISRIVHHQTSSKAKRKHDSKLEFPSPGSSVRFFEDLKEELVYRCPEYGYTLEDTSISGSDFATFNITGKAFDVDVRVTHVDDGSYYGSYVVEIDDGEADNNGIVSEFDSNAIPDQCAEAITERLASIY